jgi:hypothetical protein
MIRATASIGAALLLAPLSAHATLVVSGEYVEMTGRLNEPIVVEEGGRLSLADAEVVAPGLGGTYSGAITVRGASTLELSGHSYLTSTNSAPIAILNSRSSVRLSDQALVVSTTGNAIEVAYSPLNTIYLEDRVNVVGNLFGGADYFFSDHARVTGGVRIIDWGNFSMSGGTITAGVSIYAGGRHDVDMSGGRIDGGFRAIGPVSLERFNMFGGEIHGGFVGTSRIRDGSVFGGSISGGLVLGDDVEMSIWGGSFDAAQDGWLIDLYGWRTYYQTPPDTRQVLSIYGGEFGRSEDGQGIRLMYGTGIDVYGYDLSLVNGLLSGYLSDGNWISLAVTTTSDWYGSINLHDIRTSVPEPSTIALFLTALAGTLGFRRRKVDSMIG